MAQRSSEPVGFSATQIALHWIVVVLIAFQLLFHEGMEHAWHAVRRGQEIPADATWPANLHAIIGLTVLACAVLRLILRLTRGVPPLPVDEHPLIKFVARASHWVLYLLIFLMPLSGAAAWFGGVAPAAEAHELMVTALYVVVALHIIGALFEGIVRRSGVLTRIVKPA